MKAYLSAHLTVAFHAIVVASIVTVASWYIHYNQRNVETELTRRIDDTHALIVELSHITDRNGADALTERIITDCPRRPEFESLLNGLNNATRKELLSAQQLFESCGSYYAERKALMVAQLEREYRMLDEDLILLSRLRDLTPQEIALREWKNLISLEGERSAFLSEQTTIQAKILEFLIQGNNTTQVQELARQAQNVGESLTVTDAQIDVLRTKLMQ